MGKTLEFENFWVAAGHEGDGIALSPVTGLLMGSIIAEKIKSGKILGDFAGINIGKFSPQQQNVL
ncbi:MAG: FAD-binding oxidoreductase [Actinobacteria bacterium]|nr:FAD-binding oxidoreductase [Actinomycetota bacterium]